MPEQRARAAEALIALQFKVMVARAKATVTRATGGGGAGRALFLVWSIAARLPLFGCREAPAQPSRAEEGAGRGWEGRREEGVRAAYRIGTDPRRPRRQLPAPGSPC